MVLGAYRRPGDAPRGSPRGVSTLGRPTRHFARTRGLPPQATGPRRSADRLRTFCESSGPRARRAVGLPASRRDKLSKSLLQPPAAELPRRTLTTRELDHTHSLLEKSTIWSKISWKCRDRPTASGQAGRPVRCNRCPTEGESAASRVTGRSRRSGRPGGRTSLDLRRCSGRRVATARVRVREAAPGLRGSAHRFGSARRWRRANYPQRRVNFPWRRMNSPERRTDYPWRRVNYPQRRTDYPQRRMDFPWRRTDFPAG